jgi:hypothetical protein
MAILAVTLGACGGGGDSTTVAGPGETVTQPTTINFIAADNTAVIDFGNDVGFGLMGQPKINPADIAVIRWNSNKVGWNENTSVTGVIWSTPGKFTATLEGMFQSDQGNFSIKMKNGDVIWFNLGLWKFSSNAKLVGDQVAYSM